MFPTLLRFPCFHFYYPLLSFCIFCFPHFLFILIPSSFLHTCHHPIFLPHFVASWSQRTDNILLPRVSAFRGFTHTNVIICKQQVTDLHSESAGFEPLPRYPLFWQTFRAFPRNGMKYATATSVHVLYISSYIIILSSKTMLI
jgi:hypothetical protein